MKNNYKVGIFKRFITLQSSIYKKQTQQFNKYPKYWEWVGWEFVRDWGMGCGKMFTCTTYKDFVFIVLCSLAIFGKIFSIFVKEN